MSTLNNDGYLLTVRRNIFPYPTCKIRVSLSFLPTPPRNTVTNQFFLTWLWSSIFLPLKILLMIFISFLFSHCFSLITFQPDFAGLYNHLINFSFRAEWSNLYCIPFSLSPCYWASSSSTSLRLLSHWQIQSWFSVFILLCFLQKVLSFNIRASTI